MQRRKTDRTTPVTLKTHHLRYRRHADTLHIDHRSQNPETTALRRSRTRRNVEITINAVHSPEIPFARSGQRQAKARRWEARMSMRGECDQVVMCVRHCVSSVETCVWGFWQVQSTPGGRSRTILETYHRSCGTVPSVSYTHQRYAAEYAVGCVNRLARVLMDMAPIINVNPINKILMSEAKVLAAVLPLTVRPLFILLNGRSSCILPHSRHYFLLVDH
jgi:hypothetical protein